MESMPRPRPPHLVREITRHGKAVWYVRVGHGKRIRIKEEFGTEAFDAAYRAALAGEDRSGGARPAAGSLSWLIERYRESSQWLALSLATRRQRENILRHVIASAGSMFYIRITERVIAAGRDRRARTPFAAKHFVDTMRGLFAWAKEAGFVRVNPAAEIRYSLPRAGEGFPAWTEDDVAAYEARWPLGTRQRVWLAVLLYTGLRRGDAVRLGRQHVKDGVIRLRTEKTGTLVTIRVLPPLAEAIEAARTGDLTFIANSRGQPMPKESFGNEFRDACRAAGIRKSAHGLRKLAASRMAMAGATVAELNAVFGWTGARMASHYTQAADRERLAMAAMDKMAKMATSISAKD